MSSRIFKILSAAVALLILVALKLFLIEVYKIDLDLSIALEQLVNYLL